MTEPFALYDCGLVRRATGRTCVNLRELLDAVRSVPDGVLEHHMMRCPLEDYFELNEFPNDFARWCWSALGDSVLGEALGLADPYRHPTTAELRADLVNLIEDRLWGLDRVPWSRPGLELHLVESRLVAFDTGERTPTPTALAEAIEQMPLRSLFYHVHEARRRTQGATDDFSLWLEGFGADAALVARVRSIDFYFLNLSQLRQELLQVFRQHQQEPAAMPKVTG
jgi:hypothetical protein